MKIVITTPILFDPTSPFNHLFKDILEGWLTSGNKIVRIVACESCLDENYKMGIESDSISYILIQRKKINKTNIIQRYLIDNITNIRMAWKLLQIKDADLLFEDVSYSSFWSVMVAKKKRLRIISMMQDVWPDNAVQSRLIAYDSLIYRYFEYFQKRVYHNSNRIVCISDDMKTFIVSKGVSAEKIQVIYNWGYSDKIVHISWEENRFVQKYCLKKDTFYAVYSGNIGRMQNVEIIVNAAEELQNYSTIRFLIVGDGVSCEKIKNMISDKKLQNVTMLPMQSVELVTDINSAANVNIIPLVSGGVKTAMPSKIGVCLSCCKPILVCFDENSKFSSIVKEYGAGECVGAESSEQLAEAVKRYAVRNINCEDGAATLFKDLFTRSANVQKYIKVVEAK